MTPPAASAAAAPAIAPRRITSPRRAPATRRPRRVSGPANPARNPARGQTRARSGPAHAIGLAEAVATHRLLDRLIRGRVWIVVIAFALIGIVTMQLVLLKLNAGIGRSLVRETLLQRENATLSAENSEVAAGEQIEGQAEHEGMELIPAGALRFLTAHPSSDIGKAAAALSAPIAATSTGGEATASNASSTGEAASSTTSTGEAAASSSSPAEATSAGSTGEADAPAAATTEAASTEAPAATSETPASSASTATPAGASGAGASEAAGTSTPTGQSAPTSTGGGTPGG
jgi:hypothetical protein